MPRRCQICISDKRGEIEAGLASGESHCQLAKRYGVPRASIDRHVNMKHPPAESLMNIGDEPTLPSYEWVKRQVAARMITTQEMLAMDVGSDPFYVGSPSDIRDAEWFAETVWKRFRRDADEGKLHLRALHYLCVTSKEPLHWPDGTTYENTESDSKNLGICATKARWLGLVDAKLLDDHRNAAPALNAQSIPFIDADPKVEAATEWSEWRTPLIHSGLWTEVWDIPKPRIEGYETDEYLDQPNLVGIFIEKSTMDNWLRPLCKELSVDLYVASGVQSITNAARFVKRAVDLNKSVHLLIISDFDPQGSHMPITASRHVEYRILQVGCDVWVTADQIALTPEQIDKYNLPRKPIKESDMGRDRFEMLYGKGAVELDSLEALHPGTLEEIIRDAVDAYRDDEIDERLEKARQSADAELDAVWDERIGPLEEKMKKMRQKVVAIGCTFEKRLSALNTELQGKLKPIKLPLVRLRKQAEKTAEEIIDELELPARPRPQLFAPEIEHLFDSKRKYFQQLAHYRKISAPPKKKRRKQ